MGIGVVQIYSSSYVFAIESLGDGLFFFKKQVLFSLLGIIALIATASVPWKWIEKTIPFIWVAVTILIVLTLIPGIGMTRGGAARWIPLFGGIGLEPSEILKVMLPLMLAHLVYKSWDKDHDYLTYLKILLFSAPFGMLLLQPDFGSFVVCTLVFLSLLFVFGLKWRFVISGLGAASIAFVFLVLNVAYRKARLLSFLDPWADPSKGGYQIIQSMTSLYNGGIFGEGLGQSQGKLFFLPEAHTDFTFAILGEEWGFLGVLFIMGLFGYVIFRSFQIGSKTKDQFAKMSVIGLTLVFAMQVFINMGVVLGLLPTKGLTLPFLSYGGSSLISTCILFGLIININKTFYKKSGRRG